MANDLQLTFLGSDETSKQVSDLIKQVLKERRQPSPRELVADLDNKIGVVARWDLASVLKASAQDKGLTAAERNYLTSLLNNDDLIAALRGQAAPVR